LKINSAKLLLITFSVLFSSCQSAPKKPKEFTEKTIFPMGTVSSIKIFHGKISGENSEQVQEKINQDVDKILNVINKHDSILSHYKETSHVSRLKKLAGLGTWTESPIELINALRKSDEYYKNSNGLLDPTLEPLIKLWGFSIEKRELDKDGLPSRRLIVEALSKSGFKKVLESSDGFRKVRLNKNGSSLNFGAMGKGLSMDAAAKVVHMLGYKSVLLQLGGQQVFIGDGNFDGKPWVIGVGHPFDKDKIIRKFKLKKAGSVSTSNSSENYKEVNGRRYHHILDPRSGKPLVREVVGATVFSPSATDADALSTMLFLTGSAEGARILKKHYPNTAAYLLLKNGAERYIGPWKEWVEVQN
jgi:thiamine biosynthesis lipoprotein